MIIKSKSDLRNKNEHRNQKTRGFNYNGRPWKLKRKEILERDNYLCQCPDCFPKGILTPANTVDHDIPINQGGAPLDNNNLKAYNDKCHARKSSYERINIKR